MCIKLWGTNSTWPYYIGTDRCGVASSFVGALVAVEDVAEEAQNHGETLVTEILNKPYEKLPGTALFAPYVEMVVSTLLSSRRSSSVSFKARLDTAADLTCVPRAQAKKLDPLLCGRQVLVRHYNGDVEKGHTRRVLISIRGYPNKDQMRTYSLERGVLLTDSDIGLVGMDILKYWDIRLDGVAGRFSVERL